jgi:competence protein ComEC
VHGDVAVLVAPFLTKDAAELLDRDGWRLSANAMVVPRHGAERSVDGLIEAVGPSLAVISGASGRDGLPHASTIQRLAAIPTFRTDLHGSVRVSTDGHGLSVETERDPAAR